MVDLTCESRDRERKMQKKGENIVFERTRMTVQMSKKCRIYGEALGLT